MSPAEPLARENAPPRRWLSIIGVGEDGVAGLSEAARALIGDAEIVFGGKRHLALVAPLVGGAARPWPVPFAGAVDEVLAQRGRAVCVLASGDPFHYGIGPLLARRVTVQEMTVVPAPSSFSLAAARLGWGLPQTTLLSLHGRSLDLVRPHLQPGAQILALTSDGAQPAAIAKLLVETGFARSRVTVLEALGGPRERTRSTMAADFTLAEVDALNVVAIAVEAEAHARVIPRAPGLLDELFAHDGQISKREIRALTLSALAPRRGELLWDVGAGSGSVAIEWMLADPSLRAIAIEARADRAARIRENANDLGVPDLVVAEGRAPEALGGLAAPDAIFVGGGARNSGVLETAIASLRSGGRLVVNAVALKTESLVIDRRHALGGDLVRLDVARAGALGSSNVWRPALTVTQWRWVKP